MVQSECVESFLLVKPSMIFYSHGPVPGRSGAMKHRYRLMALFFSIYALSPLGGTAQAQESLEAILKIQAGGAGIPAAHAAAEKLISGGTTLENVIGKINGANPVAKNWLLGLAQAIADKQDPNKTRATLEKILADTKGDGEVRYWALDRLAASDTALRQKLLDGRTEDTSLDIRFEAIQQVIKQLPAVEAARTTQMRKPKPSLVTNNF